MIIYRITVVNIKTEELWLERFFAESPSTDKILQVVRRHMSGVITPTTDKHLLIQESPGFPPCKLNVRIEKVEVEE